jgi:multimeric flavodoxin WrbA
MESMKIIGINGSPWKEAGNTRKPVRSVLDGAAEQGVETELIDFSDPDDYILFWVPDLLHNWLVYM